MENVDFRPGDTIRVTSKVKEGSKERLQAFEGIVISRRGEGNNQTFTVRKIASGGICVERIWPVRCDNLKKIEVIKNSPVKKAKLYYLRDRIGKQAKKV